MDKEDLYKDHKGYYRFKDSGKSVHRWVAHKHLYLPNRKKYPLDFKEYQVHHIDKNITNNDKSNLELMLIRNHELKHNIHRHEYPLILNLLVFVGMFFIWFINLSIRYDFKMDSVMIGTAIVSAILLWWINKKKKGRRYV